MEIVVIGIVLPLIASILCLINNNILAYVATTFAALLDTLIALKLFYVPVTTEGMLYIDGFSKLLFFTISFIYLTTAIYSESYLNHVEKPLLRRNIYFLFLNLFVLSMLVSSVVDNIGLLWVSIEATTITSALLVAIDNDEAAIESSWRYIIIVSVGLIISLVGISFIYGATHTLSIKQLLNIKHVNTKLLTIGVALSVVGFSTKAGIFPLHTWLPDVHGRSIAPVSAIFSAILLPTALYAVYRVEQFSPDKVRTFSIILGFLSVGFAAIFLVSQKFYKRMFAYSSIENMGMILIGLSLNNRYALLGAIILLISHAFAKSSVFYSTGNILNLYKTRMINRIRGLSGNIPKTAYALVFSSLAIGGAPPFGNFIGELLIIYAFYSKFGLFYTLILVGFLGIAFFSINYKVASMSFSNSKTSPDLSKNISSLIPIINVAMSFLVIFFIGFIEKILFMGMIK
ncbi:proton-conducting transporter transmembrane domain-containing protein [Hippea jasoniae]|uniref:proton-conducting transporter transmembrane domain-containing protein n=1 Tax=Hippea jasoniae TaxID=944479 RepID=UPI0005570329|nr:proton-conducting transporter membrane subunit [Hippea jasoniae]